MKRAGARHSATEPRIGRTRRVFSDEYKREAVALAQQRRRERVSWAQIGRELDVRPSLLFQWIHQLEGGDGTAVGSSSGLPGETLEEENRRLRRENAILREEREFAKKAAAFFAKESR